MPGGGFFRRLLSYLPALLTAAALAGLSVAFVSELRSFRGSVEHWANRDLKTRSELAALSLEEALRTDDFRKLREFGEYCRRDGMRLMVKSGSRGGLVFDSRSAEEKEEEMFWQSSGCGDYRVHVGIPAAEVLRPVERAGAGFVLAVLIGGAGVLLFFFVTYRQHVRIRELSKVERFRREFIADFSHELKTPLTGITGAAELLEDFGSLPEGERLKLLSMIRGEASRMNGLAQGILTLAKLERGDAVGALCREKIDLAESVKRCVERFYAQSAKTGVSLEVDVPGRAVFVRCDRELLERAIDNLIANALIHSGSKSVKVSMAESGGAARIAVEDFGCGIGDEHRLRVFERFYRVDGSRDGKSGGSGLGLAIARRIAKIHGGKLELERKNTPGACFVLTVPSL
jgi:signal transduction histidine kinase